MFRPQRLLSHCQGAMQERISFHKPPSLVQIAPGEIEQTCCFWKFEVVLLNEVCTCQGLHKIALTKRPCGYLNLRKNPVHHTYRALGSQARRLIIQDASQNGLYQAMNRQHFLGAIATDERESVKFSEKGIEFERMSSNGLKGQARFGCPAG